MTISTRTNSVRVAALYKFARLDGFEALRAPLAAFCCGRGIKGTLLLAHEGINGTVAGSEADIAALVDHLNSIEGLAGLEVKYSAAADMPFHRMKVRLKREIVTMGVEDLDPATSAGTYVAPADWNALISDENTIVIDTRNAYEVSIGTFRGAVDPATASFREFPAWVERHRDQLEGRKVAMFCTGGIRCEKATAYVKSLGFEDVFHLKGGILKYLEQVPAEESLWQGECFVFDERVSVSHGLAEGEAELCRACRHPLTVEDRLSPRYAAGVSCPHCHEVRSDEDRARYTERQRQVELATARGKGPHIGS
ncbi:rhodanese-related sulfurtransferase [Mesorhizobium sp. M4B.F.Ca.ET.215.01.1.1]|uniref:oxygen-dependent tRNA uridine(34) hydroxylase TrhO n=1 Tax=unclassified Mesorhizobium TaxID=325217 RepID=UPI000FCC82A1|nr:MULTISPECIES: rhodanese-related sulfurtransferase [unclassified Mesorhizobium]RUW26444.1 rhodanese-related sulfurtransferase [Mesorhizobium sp. M4B.F.Ca.ET.013.02.1.1]RVD36378.1 rhodanese-related sulfurtransferase [Mesorhizobium sp. M4B.F.Ca.ET.019.03.1.1]RWF65442.1 MAG: rhodanese-related sulfurtransferase [Mesorhizobium sp.]TGQ14070.1 rhodanese-related sulfurtransferase [Mesorhizobium sp. M4B.F.Ca.ET.215.01.1.1]TGQ41597.1 rhodanese-related sulfurtransferase [Mesorhizobium sp. M4B.F.Ca.ET.2